MEDVVGGLNKNYRREKTTFYARVWCEGVESVIVGQDPLLLLAQLHQVVQYHQAAVAAEQ